MNKQSYLLTFALVALASAASAAPVFAFATVEQPVAVAKQIEPSAALVRRAADFVKLINGEMNPTQLFAQSALAKVPAERFVALMSNVRAKHGPALGVGRIEAETSEMGIVYITFGSAQFPVKLRVEKSEPHLISGVEIR